MLFLIRRHAERAWMGVASLGLTALMTHPVDEVRPGIEIEIQARTMGILGIPHVDPPGSGRHDLDTM